MDTIYVVLIGVAIVVALGLIGYGTFGLWKIRQATQATRIQKTVLTDDADAFSDFKL